MLDCTHNDIHYCKIYRPDFRLTNTEDVWNPLWRFNRICMFLVQQFCYREKLPLTFRGVKRSRSNVTRRVSLT